MLSLAFPQFGVDNFLSLGPSGSKHVFVLMLIHCIEIELNYISIQAIFI